MYALGTNDLPKKTDVEAFEPYAENIAPTLQTLANITEAEWNRRFPASALRRIKPAMLRRNAQAALAANQVATQESSSPEE